jgi:lysophospholipase L1-like esterase
MAEYTKQTWNNEDPLTPLNADRLNHLEDGVFTRADAVHSHPIADVSGLQGALDGKAAAAHVHPISGVTNLQAELDGKSPTGHIHAMADVANLSTSLAGKADTVHAHAISDVTGLQAGLDYKSDRKFLPVANGTHFNGNWGGTSTALVQARCRQTRKILRVIAGGATQLQVEWANIFTTTAPPSTDASCEIPGPNAVSVRMAVEYPAGMPRLTSGSTAWSSATAYALRDQVTYAGSRWVATQAGTNQTPSATSAYWRLVRSYLVRWDGDDSAGTVSFAPGSYKKSVPLPLLEPTAEGDLIAILGVFDTGSSSGYLPYAGSNGAANHGVFVDWSIDTAGGMPAAGSDITATGITTQTNGNTTAANSGDNAAWMKLPYATAITGNIPVQRCVAIFGDSIAQGYGGDIRDGEPCGIFPRALDGTSWWRVAQGGNRAVCYAPGNAPWQMSVIARCGSVISSLGVNDISNGQTVAQAKANLERVWRMLAAAGPSVFTGMLTPISASSDAWATVANQTRFTNGGTIATTQYPTDDATYLTSVYGQIAMWLSQDGASTAFEGGTIKAGQANHPLTSVLDWRSILADLATSWKWVAGFTTDGAHPISAAAVAQASLLAPQLEPVIMGKQQITPPYPGYPPHGLARTYTMPRSMGTAQNAAPAAAGGLLALSDDPSPGRWYYGYRLWSGTAASTTRFWAFLVGADASKLKVLLSGSLANTAAAGGTSGTLYTVNFPSAIWVPAGQILGAHIQNPATAGNWVGSVASVATQHKTGGGFLLSGSSTATAAVTGTVSAFDGASGGFAASTFRPLIEFY